MLFLSSDGTPVYPISSGSEDGTFLKFGLFGFSFSVLVSIVSFVFKLKAKISLGSYLMCSVCFAMALFLVLLGSNLWLSFTYGDIWPFITVCFWLLSCAVLLGVALLQSRSRI